MNRDWKCILTKEIFEHPTSFKKIFEIEWGVPENRDTVDDASMVMVEVLDEG